MVKDMTTNFGKLDKFEGHNFRRSQKKMHFLLTTLKVVYALTTPMPELVEDATVEAIRIRAKWENDDYICRVHILNGDSSSKKFLVSNFNNYKMVDSRSIMEQYNELIRILGQYTQYGLKMDESIYVSSIIDKLPPSWKDFKHTLKHGKDDLSLVQLGSHLCIEESLRALVTSKGIALVVKRTTQMLVVQERGLRTNPKVDAIAWWIDSGATTHVCKDSCWFKTFEPVEDGSVLYIGDEHFTPVHDKGSVALEFSSGKTVTLFNVLYVPKLRKNLVSDHVLNKCGYKQVYESDNSDSDSVYMSSSTVVNSSLWHARLRHVHYKRMLEMSKDDLIPTIDENPKKCTTYRCGEYYDPAFFQSIGIIHETTAPYKPQQNGVAEKKNRALKEMVNYVILLGFECGVLGVVVRLPDPKQKTLGEKGIDCIFVGYVESSKAYRFYIIEPNDSVSINSIIESRDAIFDENCFSSIPRPKDIIPNVQESQMDDHTDNLYLVEGSRDQVGSQYSYCFSIEEDPRTYNEAMQSQDAAFWKEAINDEIGSIMENNTWVLSDLPPGFKQKDGIDYFDTYAPVARITTIRLLLAFDAIHNLVIQQIDVKIAFLNGDLDKKVYIKQVEGFVMPVDETKKFLSSRFSMKDMGEADVILGIKIKRENKGIVITQSHYIEKILKKFNREDYSPMSTPMDPVEKIKPNTGKPVDHLEYSRAIGCLMYAMISTRPDIAYVVSKLSRFTSNPSRQHWKAITRVFKYLRGYYELWFIILDGCSFLREVSFHGLPRSKTCITSSSIESEFVALAAAGKDAEWLRNLINEIPIWPKPIASISIRYDSAPTMARAYSQIYNGKSRHLSVRHSMGRELIRNGGISIEFVRTQHNLADHLTKGLASDLILEHKFYLSEVQDLNGPPMAVVRLPDPKRKTLGEKGIDCIFVGYAENSKAYRFYVIEPNDSVSINSIIESRDAIFDENRFSSIPKPKDIIPNLYLVEGSRDQVGSQYFYCFSIEEDPRTYNEAMQSWDAAFWKEAIDDEIGSIMENNTWVLSDLPTGCKHVGCKWIFKRKIKVDGTIDKFKARLVIQGFRQKERIDYFDTYAPVACITTIRLLLALAAIHNLVIHQMDVKTTFLNGDLNEEVYMKQSEGFIMPGNEHKVCKLVKSLL
ncbi:zinc finger, CCHC-type containing protein [Tanacetum coccineum]|uniref:Zinc finger, CCHC-type containing protein n=1 Tax=Tanacetum coccineum TaxID=301880 RepID=A0ABQ5FH91_9ASTR